MIDRVAGRNGADYFRKDRWGNKLIAQCKESSVLDGKRQDCEFNSEDEVQVRG